MDPSVSAKNEIWFMRVCHHNANAVYQILTHKNFCRWTKRHISSIKFGETTTDDVAKKVRALKRISDGAHAVAVSQYMLRERDLRQEFFFASVGCYAIRL
jgi:hypothetical protein